MAKKERYEDLANNVLDLIGGKENIAFFTHCVTRLRFNLKDKSLAKVEEIEQIEGVVGCQWQSGQLQIIIGQAVGDAYNLICKKTGLDKQDAVNENLDGKQEKKKFSFGAVIEAIAGCVTPLIPVLIGAGMIKIVVLLGEMMNLLAAGDPTHTVLSFVGDAGFYFLPVFIGATAARKFGANMGLGMLVGAMMIHPNFIAAVGEGTSLSVFSLPIYAATYSSTVFPAIMAVFVMSYIEKFIAKLSPDAIRSITEPLFTMLIMIPLTLCLIAPLGSMLGVYFSQAIMWLYDMTGFFGVALLSAVFPFVVMTGMHTAFAPYMLQSLASLGYEPIIVTANVISNLNQGAACAAVAIKAKSTQMKSTAGSCAVTAIVGGVTEPAMFGINLKLKKPMIGAMIGSFCGAAIAGLGKAYAYAFAGSGGLFAFPVYITDDMMNVVWMAVGCLVGVVVTFIATLILYKDTEVK